MIKHRFIVSETDYKVFAAIPSESKLLTWRKWRRPPDWKALSTLIETSVVILGSLGNAWADVSIGYLKISNIKVPENLTDAPMRRPGLGHERGAGEAPGPGAGVEDRR